jgi:integrase/recombinase XerD
VHAPIPKRTERVSCATLQHNRVSIAGAANTSCGYVSRMFRKLSRQIGLRAACATHGPRLHDFRHRFAVQTLVRWYRQGKDVERHLPILSTYLGHVRVSDTYWYITSTPELRGVAGQRMEKRWGGVL